ncbi:hypothetical protein BBJ41_12060 [Burkholderia stabilis]|uniref:hypothetical protein n=1 Tax=Burkholderia stabilis TaxID=95485 RepID=UPI000851FAED|nr:hypothetical protein [Burkholderia stabilis]AOR68208.1 hypothetical protein BBJ41_12060 [Burkholderia stabilis]HDR9493148.1 hypothetical protein [Burkholderia stabilis]HDR9525221.1 hypothetical protein [Burkholderia stabilis]HDR9532536.1 hypothetical protein [Burkholderia stabilis]HDR9540424.1 hypothetical protein [Burkholderia stabilis]
MDTQKFVADIKRYVQEQAVNDLIKTFTAPPGKRPRAQLVRVSEWRAQLNSDEQQILDEVIAESVRVALFGLFAVIDGARVVDEDVDRFIITALKHDGGSVVLNEDAAVDLHSEFAPD